MADMMEQNNGFEFCSESSPKKWLHLWTSLGVGVLLTITLKMMPRVGESNSLVIIKGTTLHIVTSLMTLVGTAALIFQESYECGSLLNCSSYLPAPFTFYALTKWIAFSVHSFFMVRTVVEWTRGVSTYTGMVITTVNVALFVEDVMALITHHHLIAFQYLFLFNFQCPEVKWFLRSITDNVLPLQKVILIMLGKVSWVTFILAGTLRVAEEWQTNDSFIPDSEDSLALMQTNNSSIPDDEDFLAPMQSSFSYVYWTIVTISTVGFGDLTPSTPAGQFVIMVTIISFLVWFGNITSDLYDHLEQTVKKRSKSSIRHLIIGCKTRHQLENFLKTFEETGQNITVLVDSDNTELANIVNDLGLEVIEESDIKKAILTTMCPGQKQDFLYFLHDPTLDPEESKQRIFDITKAVRDNGCKATILAEI